MIRNKTLLEHWIFNVGDSADCCDTGREVGRVHTWNVESGREDYQGEGWYRHELDIPKEWEKKRVFAAFGAVYHDAEVFVNGKKAASHTNSGYTPFTVELTAYLLFGGKNQLTVKASNRYTDRMLPCNRSFDWANDGGMIRSACLYTTGADKMDSVRIVAKPVLSGEEVRQEEGRALIKLAARVDGKRELTQKIIWEIFAGPEAEGEPAFQGELELAGNPEGAEKKDFSLEFQTDKAMNFWHFDRPFLYWMRLTLLAEGHLEDTVSIRFGIRDFQVKKGRFYLNGEPVRLCGTEWMPGSDPAFGMAEPKEQLEKMLFCIKESNCVFTRFHWQQDEAVYDWCDEHGMLVQEEIPFWGKDPAEAGEQQWETAKAQAAEMVEAHGNHPCIVSWGIGNELDGQSRLTQKYIREAVAYVHALDETRTANYVSNSFYENGREDGTMLGDIMMINEYAGTWMPDADASAVIGELLAVCPDKPLVISEFGLCEPAFAGGDARRGEQFTEKMQLYRRFPQIAGTINFCLNDYRTQMGEAGEGKWRRRVHGSTTLDGTKKPSYEILRRECAPFFVEREKDAVRITCRKDLPCYEMKGYRIKIQGQKEGIPIPDLRPGDSFRLERAGAGRVTVYRANGDFCGTFF